MRFAYFLLCVGVGMIYDMVRGTTLMYNLW